MRKDYLLAKWLNKNITNEELTELKSSSEYATYIKIAEATSKLKIPSFNIDANFKAISSQIKLKDKVIRLKPMATFLKIAAVIAVLFTVYLFINSLDTTIETKIAEKQYFLLPDDSKVVLNANSTINYNKKDWKKSRELTLNGEAYFNVSKGKKFLVITQLGIVNVLGTQFNVLARDDNFYIKCYEGLVSVSFNDTIIKLSAGKKLKIENGVLIKHYKNNTSSPGWIANESSFENTTLAIVLKEFERQYPIKITTKNINVNKRFSGSFTHNNLNLALKSVCDPLNLSFTINGEDVTIYAKDNK
ncbi:MAG: FecR family protein [Bacteroidetes bacterium]|nr:FecR family protein [Bacteroidota bacterium]